MAVSHVVRKTGLFAGLILVVFAMTLMVAPAPEASGQTVQQLIGGYVPDASDPQYKEIGEALIRFNNGDVNNARILLKSAVKKNPNLPPADVLLAQLLFGRNQTQGAQMALEAAVKEYPDDPEAYVLLSDLLDRQRYITASGLLLEKAETLNKAYDRNKLRKSNLEKRIKAGLARVAESQANWPKAIKYYQEWLKIDPDNLTAASRLGTALFRNKQFPEAYKHLQTFYEGHTKTAPRFELTMALLYEQAPEELVKGADQLSKKLIGFAETRDPKNPVTRLAVAQWGLRNGELDTAKRNANEVLKLAGATPAQKASAQLLLGRLARYEGDYPTAEKMFRAVHTVQPTNFQTNDNLALALLAQDDDAKRDEAVNYARLNLQLAKGTNASLERQAAITLAWILYSIQRENEAQRVLAQVLRGQGTISAESAYLAAKMLADRKADTALKLLEPAMTSKGFFPQRKEAEKLLQQLKKTTGAGGGS